jgi:hypothetical protein
MYKYPLIALCFLIPFLLIGDKNTFISNINTIVRLLVSTFVLWGYFILSGLIVDSVNISFDCCNDNGQTDASRAFYMVLGWAPSLLISLAVYIVIKFFMVVKNNTDLQIYTTGFCRNRRDSCNT